jgi:hypothetical protein
MTTKIDLDGGCKSLYSSKDLDKLTLKQEETTHLCRNSLPIRRDSIKNPSLSRIFHQITKKQASKIVPSLFLQQTSKKIHNCTKER